MGAQAPGDKKHLKGFTMTSPVISDIRAREILDSKGIPMVEADVVLEDGTMGRGAAPCGISVGRHEAIVLRDGGTRYRGLGVQKAIGNILKILRPALLGRKVEEQRDIDALLTDLDGTSDKSRLGANALYSVSIATARAAAASKKIPLFRHLQDKNVYAFPFPVFNMINGGSYGNRRVEIQEFHLIPTGASSFCEAMRMGVEVFYALKDAIIKSFGRGGLQLGNSAGYACPDDDPETALALLLEAAEMAGYAGRIRLGMDSAASGFYNPEEDLYSFRGKKIEREFMIDYLAELSSTYPILLMEDPLHEDDFEGHAEIMRRFDGLVVGDDLFVTRKERLEKGIQMGSANAVVIKPNMVGTLSEAMDAAFLAVSHEFWPIPSGRGGGTVDDPVTDIALALDAPLVKFGAPRAGEKINKYNRLLQIEDEMGEKATFPSLTDRIPPLRRR